MARVLVVGAGYVGLCTAAALAEHGHRVTVLDVDPRRVESVIRGKAPFHEPGIDELLSRAVADGRITAASTMAAVDAHEFVFLCVGTPEAPDGRADMRFIRSAAADVGRAVARWANRPVVITKSTVPPGTAREVVTPELQDASGLRAGEGFLVASVPEFLKEGSAVKDAIHPDRIVVGADHPDAASKVWTLFERHGCPKITVDCPTAEMIKYAANAFLATKIALSNELANVAAAMGVDWYKVAEGIGHDARIGPLFLRAGAGFGGSCFPKDVSALSQIASDVSTPSGVLEAVLESNELQPLVTIRLLEQEIGALAGKRIALLGLAFKADTDDVRETRALPIYEALRKAGADVVVHDPIAVANFLRLAGPVASAETPEAALAGADGCIVQTEWAEYRALSPASFRAMRAPVVIDGRRTFDPALMRAAGIRYRAIGLGSPASASAR